MFYIIWLVVCLVIAASFILKPGKITDKPGSRIKNPAIIRGLGILVVILCILAFVMEFFG